MKLEFRENFLTHSKYLYSFHVALGVLSICFLLSTLYWNTDFEIIKYLIANPDNVFINREYWRLFTTIFVHGDMSHLLSNSLMLLVMGNYVYSFYGKWHFPVISILMGAVVNIFVLMNYEKNISIVGISGVVYYLWGYWLYMYLKVQTQLPLLRRIMKVTIVGAFMLIPEVFAANVSHLSHFLGFVLGVLVAALYWGMNHKKIKAEEKYEMVYEDWELEPETFDINEFQSNQRWDEKSSSFHYKNFQKKNQLSPSDPFSDSSKS